MSGNVTQQLPGNGGKKKKKNEKCCVLPSTTRKKRVTQGSLNISKTTIKTPTRPLPDKTRGSEEKGRDKWRRKS